MLIPIMIMMRITLVYAIPPVYQAYPDFIFQGCDTLCECNQGGSQQLLHRTLQVQKAVEDKKRQALPKRIKGTRILKKCSHSMGNMCFLNKEQSITAEQLTPRKWQMCYHLGCINKKCGRSCKDVTTDYCYKCRSYRHEVLVQLVHS